jgi:hypothetical protein
MPRRLPEPNTAGMIVASQHPRAPAQSAIDGMNDAEESKDLSGRFHLALQYPG